MLAPKYIALATTPIGEDDFAGPDVRYSSEYEALEAELEKANSLHQNGGPDWQKVTELAEQLLGAHSKDLRVACWLTWGLFREQGITGLQAGIGMLVRLCADHWASLHPRKDRTRAAALGWLVGRIEGVSSDLSAANSSLDALLADLKTLDSCLQAHLGDAAPLLLPVCNRLRTQVTQSSTTTASTEAEPRPLSLVSSNTSVPAPSGAAAPAEDIFSARDAHRALRHLQEQARLLCQWWQSQSVQDARAISLSRVLLWLPIEALPEHDAGGKTGLRGLPADRLASFRERMNQGKPAELLRDLEQSVARAPFWLDGQHLAWQCLEALKATDAQRVLEQHLAHLLQRLPGLEKLKFFDGTAFANQDTLTWLATASGKPAVADISNADLAASGDTPWECGYREALEALGKEGLRSAMAVLNRGQLAARGGRAKAHWQLCIARLCRHAGKLDLARNLLEALEQHLRDSGLAEWEPELLIRVMRLLHECYEHLPATAAMRQRRNEIFQRLCHLDFEVVLETALRPKQ